MTDILIESLHSTGGTLPDSGLDATGLYSGWALTEVAQLGLASTDTLTVPGDYVTGDDLVLVIREKTPGVSKKHKWQAVVTLNTGTPTTYTAEYTSSATANTESVRLFTISLSGEVNGVAIAGEDELTVVFSRIAASGTEDPNDIKVYAISLRVSTEPVAMVFSGRVQTIYQDVLTLANEQGGLGYASPQNVLTWINQCTMEIVDRLQYWKKYTTIDVTGGLDPIPLLEATLIPDLYQVITMRWIDSTITQDMVPISTGEQLLAGRATYPSGEVAIGYYIQNNQLYLVPAITTTVTNAIQVYHSYIPTDLTGLVGSCDPELPRSFDKTVYVPFCRAQWSLKDKGGKTAESDFQKYMVLFERGLRRLAGQNTTPGFQLRPYR